MKKSLFAIAAVTAFAGAAQAQSSVTVYGILDVGYIGQNSRIANNAATAGGTVAQQTNSQFGQSAQSTSRLGFKGNEDLGGGLSAFFTIETAITPNAQNAIQTNVSSSNRQTFVGLKKHGVGQFALGTQYTTIHNAVAATDPGMQNNMQGNVIYDKPGFNTPVNGSALSGGTGTTTAGSVQFSGQQDNTSYTVRANNMLSLQSDNFAGFQGNAFYVMNNQNANQATVTSGTGTAATTAITGGTTNNNGFGLGVNYTWTKLLVTANYQQFTDKGLSTINGAGQYSAGNPIQGGFGGTTVYGQNAKDNQQYYAATYDFGILKGYLQYVNRKTLDVNNPNNYVARTAQQIGVRSYITPTVESWASFGTGKLTVSQAYSGTNALVVTTGTGSNAANFGGFQLGTNYWLSKRTNLYAIYGQQRTSNQMFGANANQTSYNSNDYAVGVRHTF
ncbi:Outer membrane protein (porin) [Polynucleobacter meluiroseus]|uniref:Outer membrane protein (Porin) n=1 Tax=Polynucleobacter meluiroseus TaxID=1938814 RepID=A0A240E0F1_9BURK|nr:porin [Polynucleobacter meluiroseus]SNX28918.1 Outer membrane protein (porin) [Polynucleobacter meluiroseus]